MAIEWINGFLLPLLKTIFYIAIIGGFLFIVIRAFAKTWSRSMKFTLKYKIFRKKYPEYIVAWIVEAIGKGIGYYEAQKMLLIKETKQESVNEILYVFDQVLNEMKKGDNKKYGKTHSRKEVKEHGRQITRHNRETEITENNLPNL